MTENEQDPGVTPTDPPQASVQETVQRYRTVETVRASDTNSLEVVLSDTQSGDQSGTTPVEVPRITVDQDAPESPSTETPRPSSQPVSPRRPTVDRKVLKQPLPEVPNWLERTGEDVRVVLRYAIDREGNVSSIDVLGSSGYPALDDRSIERLGAWKYEPGTPVNEALTVFEFRLK
jgi:TonB family protein